MSERYYQDYNTDGWPIIDAKYIHEMSRNCIVGSLNEYESMVAELRIELEQERERVRAFTEASKNLAIIVKIHSRATNNNFAWAELECLDEVLSTEQGAE